MMRLALSPAARALLRALIRRTGMPRDRTLLTEWHSVDWQSLTFTGERHQICLRITGPDSAEGAKRLAAGLEDAEFAIPGHVVADIAVIGEPRPEQDDSTTLSIEALTIAD